jgi:hypothetical protein
MAGSVTRDRKNADILKKAMADIERHCVKIGFFENSKYEDGTPVAYIAAIQEFGYEAGGIPSRSFMRTTQKENTKRWTDMAFKAFVACGKGRISAEDAYDRLGMDAQKAVFKKIKSIKLPELADGTIAARKRAKANGGKGATAAITKPLIDTGTMLAAVSYEVATSSVEST